MTILDIRAELKALDDLSAYALAVAKYCYRGYVVAYLDEFFLPESPVFEKHHNKHETLLCGFDAHNLSVYAAHYDQRGAFIVHAVPLVCILAALRSVEGWPKSYTFDNVDMVEGFTQATKKPVYAIDLLSSRAFQLNVSVIAHQIRDSISERCTYERYIGDPFTNWVELDGCFGVACYSRACELMDEAAGSNREFDARIYRLFFEHKEAMLLRMRRLKETGIALPQRAQSIFEDLKARSRSIHLGLMQKAFRPDASFAAAARAESTIWREKEIFASEQILKALDGR